MRPRRKADLNLTTSGTGVRVRVRGVRGKVRARDSGGRPT